MKRVYFVRHAKSSWSNTDLPDIDRPLNERGYNDAYAMGRHLYSKKYIPHLIISSPAIRTMSTALILSRALRMDEGKILIAPSLYEASTKNYRQVIEQIEENHSHVFIVAHNPTISDVFSMFTSDNSGEMPTCAIGIAEFDVDKWSEIDSVPGKSLGLLTPSLISAM